MSVAMALAEFTHHTAPRGQRTARAREEGREVHGTVAFRTTVPPPRRSSSTSSRSPVGSGPTCWSRRAHRWGSSGAPWSTSPTWCMVQILDIPVLQVPDQLVEVWRHLDFHIPEQVIEVPKISASSCYSWCSLRRRRQNSWWKCPRSCPYLLFSSALLSTLLPFLFPVVEVVVYGEVFKVFSQDRIQQRSLRRSLTFQFLVVKVSSQDRVQQRFLVLISQRWSTLHPRQRCSNRQFLWESTSHLHLRCFACPSQWWSTLLPRR